jgi:hypothetical protein
MQMDPGRMMEVELAEVDVVLVVELVDVVDAVLVLEAVRGF